MSLHSMRSGASARPSASWSSLSAQGPGGEVAGASDLVLHQGLRRVAGHGLEQRPLVAALRHPELDPDAAQLAQPVATARRRRRAAPAPAPRAAPRRRTRRRRPGGGSARPARPVSRSSTWSTTQPRWPRTRPPRTWNTWTAASSSSSASATTSASVPSPSTTALLSIARSSAPMSSRSRAARSKSCAVGGGLHLALEPRTKRRGLAGHEVAEVLDDRAVLLGGRPARRTAPSTCRCSPAGTGRPIWPARLNTPGDAGAHREHPQQQVEGLADGPGVGVRAEVAHALALAGRASTCSRGNSSPR